MNQVDTLKMPARPSQDKQRRAQTHICMHVLGTARTDVRVMREAVALVEAGYVVTVVDIESDPKRGPSEELTGVRLRHVIMPSWFIPTRFKPWFLVKLARTFLVSTLTVMGTKADFYHAHEENALVATYVASRLHHKPLVFDAHELPLVDPHVTRWKTLVRIARSALRALTKGTQATITVSPPIGPKIQEMYGGPPAVIVRNLPAFRTVERTNRLREYFGLPESMRIALYQGNLAPDRSLDKLVYAAHTLPENVVIVILGRGPSEEPLKRLIAAEGVESRVLMAPFVPYQELLSWTTSADLGLILYNPDFSENVRMCLPNKLFEYAMVGLPVLASPLIAVNEVMERYQFGRVAQRLDPVSFGEEIGALANDTAALAVMRRNALIAAREHLNWETEQHTLVSLYDRLSAESPARKQRRKA